MQNERCARWIDLAYNDWLQWERNQNFYLRPSTQNIVAKMRAALNDPSQAEVVWNTVERLKRLAGSYESQENEGGSTNYRHESAEIYLECAIVAYKMGDLKESLSLFANPRNGFRERSLHKAITYWMLGCVQWQLQSHLEDAIVSWERSLQIVMDVEKDYGKSREATAQKCREIRAVMEDAILYASVHNCPPPIPKSPDPPKQVNVNNKRRSAYLRLFPFYGRIPAGPPGWLPPIPDDVIELGSIHWRDKEYAVYSLTDELSIPLQRDKVYFFLEVNGNSMNRAMPIPIEKGDLVLMSKQKEMSGDIVAVEIIKEDEVATLKRYRFKDGKHWLEPETDDPSCSPAHISMTEDFHIRGVVVAVLKPIVRD